MQIRSSALLVSAALACGGATAILGAQAKAPAPPAGFTVLFNGKDLGGWRGRPGGGGVFSPVRRGQVHARGARGQAEGVERRPRSPLAGRHREGRDRLRRQRRAPRHREGVRRLRVPRRLAADAAGRRLGDLSAQLSPGPALGSRESARSEERRGQGIRRPCGTTTRTIPGKWPLVKADNPIGEWNSLAIKMVGTRVWVTLNGKPVVVGQVLDNFFDRAQPVLPTGSIELQTHGSEVRFRNIYVREIPGSRRQGAAGDRPRRCAVREPQDDFPSQAAYRTPVAVRSGWRPTGPAASGSSSSIPDSSPAGRNWSARRPAAAERGQSIVLGFRHLTAGGQRVLQRHLHHVRREQRSERRGQRAITPSRPGGHVHSPTRSTSRAPAARRRSADRHRDSRA